MMVDNNTDILKNIKKGNAWLVAELLLKRNRHECRNLWIYELDESKKRGGFSVDEIALVLKGIYECGEYYSLIAERFFQRRGSSDVHNRWWGMKFKFEVMFLEKGHSREIMLNKDPNFISPIFTQINDL